MAASCQASSVTHNATSHHSMFTLCTILLFQMSGFGSAEAAEFVWSQRMWPLLITERFYHMFWMKTTVSYTPTLQVKNHLTAIKLNHEEENQTPCRPPVTIMVCLCDGPVVFLQEVQPLLRQGPSTPCAENCWQDSTGNPGWPPLFLLFEATVNKYKDNKVFCFVTPTRLTPPPAADNGTALNEFPVPQRTEGSSPWLKCQ